MSLSLLNVLLLPKEEWLSQLYSQVSGQAASIGRRSTIVAWLLDGSVYSKSTGSRLCARKGPAHAAPLYQLAAGPRSSPPARPNALPHLPAADGPEALFPQFRLNSALVSSWRGAGGSVWGQASPLHANLTRKPASQPHILSLGRPSVPL